MSVNQPSNIYREQLSSAYHGLALWDPKPVENLHKEPGHVSIGDVGYLDNGAFMRMFNVTLPWDHPSNKLLVNPDKYECIEPNDFCNVRNTEVREGEYCSPHVSKVENLRANQYEDAIGQMYQCSTQHCGAFLSLPHKGYRKDVIPIKVFENYIKDNVDNWFRWSKNRGLPVEHMEDLILVTGCTLATSWAAAAFDGHMSIDSNATTISLETRDSDSGGAQFFWRNTRGRVEYHNSNFDPNVQERLPQNQCVFIRGFRAKRIFFRTRPMRAAAEPLPDDPDNHRGDEIQVTRIPGSSKYCDPLVGILDYILEKCNDDVSAAEDIIAIAHDDDLRLIEGVETLTADAIEKFLREKQMPLLIENGAAILSDSPDIEHQPPFTPASSTILILDDPPDIDSLTVGHEGSSESFTQTPPNPLVPLHSSSRRVSLPSGSQSTSGVSTLLRRFSNLFNSAGGVASAGQPPTNLLSLINDHAHDASLHPASSVTVHQYILKSRGKEYAQIIVRSHAFNSHDPPVLYFGEDITGFVILSLSDLSSMQSMDVVLQVFDLDPIIPRFEVKRTLSSQHVDESHISGGNFCWPFTITPPTEPVSLSGSSADSTPGSQSSNDHGGDVTFQLIVTICRRGRLTRNVGVKQQIFYVPHPDPSPCWWSSPARTSISLPGDAAPTSTLSMSSWPQGPLPVVCVRGVMFNRVDVEVECKLIAPSEYLASDAIPLRLVLTSENYEALDLFSMSHVIDVRLQKVMAFGDRARVGLPLTLRDRDSFQGAELAAKAIWERDGNVKELPPDERHKLSRRRVKLNGVLQKIHGVELIPSYEEPGASTAIMYAVSFFPFRATEFRPANDPNKELVIAKIKLTKPS